MPWRLMGPRGIEQVSVSGPITADDLGTVKSLTLAGLGISLFPDILVRAEEQSGKLERLLPAYAVRGAATYVVSPPLRHVPSRVTLLRDHLLAEMERRLRGTPCAVSGAAAKHADATPARIKAGARR